MNTLKDKLLRIDNDAQFEQEALLSFRHQAENNPVYAEWCAHLKVNTSSVTKLNDIPFLPISFFKSHDVLCRCESKSRRFLSSGTGGERSAHWISDEQLYRDLSIKGFEHFFGSLTNRPIFALLPHYLENGDSSLVAMCQYWMGESGHADSGFFLHQIDQLMEKLEEYKDHQPAPILIGASYALLDLAKKNIGPLGTFLVFETGGMKGREKEMIRSELHEHLCNGFGLENIYSEYGMTELLSQAYMLKDDCFETPPWMRIQLRDARNPLDTSNQVRRGCVNIIDLANSHSCSFIATDDLGERCEQGVRILGRLDSADIRGCNLLVI